MRVCVIVWRKGVQHFDVDLAVQDQIVHLGFEVFADTFADCFFSDTQFNLPLNMPLVNLGLDCASQCNIRPFRVSPGYRAPNLYRFPCPLRSVPHKEQGMSAVLRPYPSLAHMSIRLGFFLPSIPDGPLRPYLQFQTLIYSIQPPS